MLQDTESRFLRRLCLEVIYQALCDAAPLPRWMTKVRKRGEYERHRQANARCGAADWLLSDPPDARLLLLCRGAGINVRCLQVRARLIASGKVKLPRNSPQ